MDDGTVTVQVRFKVTPADFAAVAQHYGQESADKHDLRLFIEAEIDTILSDLRADLEEGGHAD